MYTYLFIQLKIYQAHLYLKAEEKPLGAVSH